MPRIERSVEIEVPLEKGFWYIVDGENSLEWYPDVRGAKRIAGEVGPTLVMRYVVEIRGKRYEFETRVVEWDPPKRYVDESRFKTRLVKRYVHEGVFEPTEHGFKYTFILDYHLGPTGLGWTTDRLRKRDIERSIEKSLEKLKHVLESKFKKTQQ
ncbi:MAG: SRPBCC family protein [Thaumarchaeota archaeon]|jgi:uncharacterized protein YndB with AHSA1/START domain|nr:SRPBCC family protein [Candidatus Geocrenenecus arthurdayi]